MTVTACQSAPYEGTAPAHVSTCACSGVTESIKGLGKGPPTYNGEAKGISYSREAGNGTDLTSLPPCAPWDGTATTQPPSQLFPDLG